MSWDGIHRKTKQKESKMDRTDALRKIEELRKFVEECDKKPEVKLGQLWKFKNGDDLSDVYIVLHPDDGPLTDNNFRLTDIKYGHQWNASNGFNRARKDFKYIGMASDLIKIK